METYAKLKNAKISAQKVRLVADQIRGMEVESAVELLKFSNKKSCPNCWKNSKLCDCKCRAQ